MKKRYQKILGVTDSVTPEELKKAFRKKANEFHPDKNPSIDAQKQFIEICDAYKALLEDNFEEEAKIQVNRTTQDKKYNRNVSPEELDARLQRAREYAKIKAFKEKNIRELSYHQIRNSKIKYLHILACILSIIVLTINSLDFLIIKPIEIKGQLISQTLDGVYMRYDILDIEASQQHALDHPHAPYHSQYISFYSKINNSDWDFINNGASVTIYKSFLFGDLLGMSRSSLTRDSINRNAYRFHLLFWIYFVMLCLPIIIAFTRGPNSFYIITIYLSTYLSLVTSFFYFFNLLSHLNA